jgi:hypothetical protein
MKQSLLQAIRHQNLIGWNMFLKGFTSQYWNQLYCTSTEISNNHKVSNWGVKVVENDLVLLRQIWGVYVPFL